jgi:chorismate mutase/prephenate dehydratase
MAKSKSTGKRAGSSASKKTARRVVKKSASASSKKKSAKKSPAKKKSKTVKKPKPKAGGSSLKKKAAAPSLENDIRRLDGQILKLINQRAETTTRFIESKPNPHKALFEPRSDDDLWQRLEAENPGPLPAHAVRGIFRQIISAARRRVKTQRVAYLGPPFSFTHLAAIERFGEMADLYPVSTISSVFEEVNRANASYGVVPIENSTDGRIIDTLDMFQQLPLQICGEVALSIHLNLLAKCPRSDITEIYSKPQALSQCRDWLARNMPQARLYPVTSTSTAAELARSKAGVGAIASKQAGIEYDLDIIAENIEDNANNVTRFAVIGDEISRSTGRDRTSILLQIPDKPGTLSDVLVIFKKAKINLTWIESFPVRGPEKGYQFFLDLEGHASEARIGRVLSELEKQAVRIVLLGSYPQTEPRG